MFWSCESPWTFFYAVAAEKKLSNPNLFKLMKQHIAQCAEAKAVILRLRERISKQEFCPEMAL